MPTSAEHSLAVVADGFVVDNEVAAVVVVVAVVRSDPSDIRVVQKYHSNPVLNMLAYPTEVLVVAPQIPVVPEAVDTAYDVVDAEEALY